MPEIKKETQTKEVQEKYQKNVEVTLTEIGVASKAPYSGLEAGTKRMVTAHCAKKGKYLGYFEDKSSKKTAKK
jgi:hypothetical protein